VDVTYLGHYGDDLTVVNAARVSFGKRVQEFRPDKDARLLSYLARHKHELPFAHPHVSFHFKAPIFVARQLAKHQVGFVWSEISRRYVKDTPELYWPREWRKGSEDIKQGSTDEVFEDKYGVTERVDVAARSLVWDYKRLVAEGCCAEQARMILPQNMMTEWVWTGSLAAFARVCKLRLDPHSQRETQEIAKMISDNIPKEFNASWNALMEN
jgi:thymidylate synthase (FAD)